MLQISVIESLDTLCGKMTWEAYRKLISSVPKDSILTKLIDDNHFELGYDEKIPCIIELVNDENLSDNTMYVSSYIKNQFFSNTFQIDIDNPSIHRHIGSVGRH